MKKRFTPRKLTIAFLLLTLPACATVVLILLTIASCSSFDTMAPDAHLVAAPISARANTVLQNCVKECGSAGGRWAKCMGPGCTTIWATQFGYRAGVRRNREDIVALGRTTAGRASSDLTGLFLRDVFGSVDRDDPAVYGFPAMAVSGSLGGRGIDATIFSKGLDRVDELETPAPNECAGLAALLAEAALLIPEEAQKRLEQARGLARKAAGAGNGRLAFMAWAAIARASRKNEDIGEARNAWAATPYRFDSATGALQPLKNEVEMLSLHLATVHGLCDLAQATGDASAQGRAVTLLDYLFSDAYFDGRFLCHDRTAGVRSKAVCSGCNFMALYLVDRLYGDTFVIDPVPALPERDWPEEGPARREWDHTLVLQPGRDGKEGHQEFTLETLAPQGRILLRHATRDVRIQIEYELLSPERVAPDGGVWFRFQPRGEDSTFPRNTYTHELEFDAAGVAPLSRNPPFLWFYPLMFAVTFKRNPDGSLSAEIRMKEGEK